MPETHQKLKINLPDELTLTPFAGASLVNEILKGLLYQKCQIPYPYTWLKQVVEKRRKKLDTDQAELKKVNFTHENHYRVVSTAYDHLDLIMKSIVKEFCEGNCSVEEIMIVFGPSPNCAKEVFTVTIPSIVRGHIERNHTGLLNKHLQKTLRNIFLSQAWMDSIDASNSCTNTYIYLKKIVHTDGNFLSEAFEYCQAPFLNTKIKHSKFSIHHSSTERTKMNCCSDLVVFEENLPTTQEFSYVPMSGAEGRTVWCRSKGMFKGFKDCFINKISVCELW